MRTLDVRALTAEGVFIACVISWDWQTPHEKEVAFPDVWRVHVPDDLV